MLHLNRIGPVGVDAEALGVGDDQQRRMFQRDRIKLELLIGAVEVCPVLFVFPAERPRFHTSAKPPRPSVLETPFSKRVAVRIGGLVRRRLAEHPAQIDEMFLRRLPLGPVGAAPFVDELRRGSCGEN